MWPSASWVGSKPCSSKHGFAHSHEWATKFTTWIWTTTRAGHDGSARPQLVHNDDLRPAAFVSAPIGPFSTQSTKKRKYYKIWDQKGAMRIAAIAPSDHEAFLGLMKDHTRVECMPEEEINETTMKMLAPLKAEGLYKISLETPKKKDLVLFVVPSEFAECEGKLLGLDGDDAIVKLLSNNDIIICPMAHLVKLIPPPQSAS